MCAFVIQLNNAIDYNVTVSSLFVNWNLVPPIEYLSKELIILSVQGLEILFTQFQTFQNTSLPILVNLHQCSGTRSVKVKRMLNSWMLNMKATFKSNQKVPRLGVFYAHVHGRHEVVLECMGGYKIPFVYIGSVPNNR